MPGKADDFVAGLGEILDLRNAIPEELGLRRYTVSVRTRTWDSGKTGVGNPCDSNLVLTPTPKLEELEGDRRIRLSMITPAYAGPPAGGYTRDELRTPNSKGVESYYVVEGANGAHRYTVESIDTSGEGSSMRYTVLLTSLTRPVPN